MGVLGLWQLLAPVGQPVSLESLENKIFAVDISIWLNQAVKGYRDSQGGSVPNAHLLSLFSRLCKLLFYKIKPIIVFDGGFPELKKQTIINRQQRRAAIKQSSREAGLKILSNYIASQKLSQVGAGPSPTKNIIKHKEKARDEIYKLPPVPSEFSNEGFDFADKIEWKFTTFCKEDIKYLNQIDLESEDFNNLPPDVKQDILSTLKESRRHRTWEQQNELPDNSNDFSNYQLQCLLKKRKLSRKLEEVQKDMRQINTADIVSQYTNDHVIGETNKIMSDDYSHYVLLKKMPKIQETSDKSFPKDKLDPSNVSMMDTKTAFIKDIENIDILEEEMTKTKVRGTSFDESHLKNIKEEPMYDENVDDPSYDKNKMIQGILDTYESLTTASKSEDVNLLSVTDVESNNLKPETMTSDKKTEISKGEKTYSKSEFNFKRKHCEDKPESILLPVEKKLAINQNSSKAIINDSLKDIIHDENNQEAMDTVLTSSEDELVPCENVYIDLNFNIVNESLEITEEMALNQAILASITDKPKEKSSEISTIPHNLSQMPQNIAGVELDKSYIGNNAEAKSFSDVDDKNMPDYYSMPSTSGQREQIYAENEDIAQRNQLLQKDLQTVTSLLEADRAKQDRQSRTVQDHMVEDCKELLQLFGIPYVVSPTEAEAQCAFYDYADLTNGTITDDSDVWLFGGKRVYKNFFAQQKYVELYKDNEIFNHFGLSRKKLINFAMLTGSDYTEGIEGVGPVTAMEILSEFPGEDIEVLHAFRGWWDTFTKNSCPPENKVRTKLLKLVLSSSFPDDRIADAYMNPDIDDSREKFSWGRPDLDALRDYTKERFGWNKCKVDDALLPVMKKLNERNAQTHIDNFFSVSLKKQEDLFPSKRIMSALKKMKSPEKCNGSSEKSQTTMKKATKRTKSKSKVNFKVDNKRRKSVTKTTSKVLNLSEDSSDET